jgi:CDP-diglyceride synthetase
MLKNRAKSIFKTKTFQGAALGFMAGLAPVVIPCFYQTRMPSQDETIALAGLTITFVWALVGRIQTSAVYTPDGLPGPNKSDFQ